MLPFVKMIWQVAPGVVLQVDCIWSVVFAVYTLANVPQGAVNEPVIGGAVLVEPLSPPALGCVVPDVAPVPVFVWLFVPVEPELDGAVEGSPLVKELPVAACCVMCLCQNDKWFVK